ncbi:MAG: DUF2335 domain-containing protein [bacterium]|nr:DUF2335 domain-containing protein [bacterium]
MNQSTGDQITSSKAKASPKQKEMSLIAMREMYSGPLPHPEMLAKYEKIHKGISNRIVRMAEKQSEHRQKIEIKVIDSNILNEKLGMVLAFIISISVIVGGIFLISVGKNIQGLVTLGSIIALQLYNYYIQQKKEGKIQEKNK